MGQPYHGQSRNRSYTIFPNLRVKSCTSIRDRIPSTRITYYSHDENERENRFNLALVSETRGNALMLSTAQKQRMTRLFNRNVKTRYLQIGDLVLRKVEATGKFAKKACLGLTGTDHSKSSASSNLSHLQIFQKAMYRHHYQSSVSFVSSPVFSRFNFQFLV